MALHRHPWLAISKGIKALSAAAAKHIRQSVKQNTHNWIPPVADKWTQQGAFLHLLPLPEAIGNIWHCPTNSTRCSAVRHSWRSLDERRWQTIRWPLTHTHTHAPPRTGAGMASRDGPGKIGPVEPFGNPFGDGKLEEMLGVPGTVRKAPKRALPTCNQFVQLCNTEARSSSNGICPEFHLICLSHFIAIMKGGTSLRK